MTIGSEGFQGGAPLFVGSNDSADNQGMPLGIKTISQGIEEFTDWRSISDTLEENKMANFEDAQPTKIKFSQLDYLARISSDPVATANAVSYRVVPEGYTTLGFEDSWKANKVKVYDDMAFVAYDEYTDIHRVDIEIPDAELRQHYVTQFVDNVYDQIITTSNTVGTLQLETQNLTPFDVTSSVTGSVSDQFGPVGFGKHVLAGLPMDFASYQNCILKVEFSGTINRGQRNLPADEGFQNIPKVMYFMYGGALSNDFGDYNTALSHAGNGLLYDLAGKKNSRGILSNGVGQGDGFFHTNTVFNDSNKSQSELVDSLLLDEEAVVGKFFLVCREQIGDYKIPSASANTIGIQLSIQCNYGNTFGSPDETGLIFPYKKFGPDSQNNTLYYQTVDVEKVTLIKLQPVRKCGKVDIYTKKRGIISGVAVEGSSGPPFDKFPIDAGTTTNIIESLNHNLQTNDIIEISGCLFDGNQNGVADTHPMNGVKYVKVIDDNNFKIYEDQYFSIATSTADLRAIDGVIWTCISNNFGDIGQSWDYHGTMFSPTGRNGYKFVTETEGTQDSLATSDQFFTTTRLKKLDDTTSDDPNEASITLDFSKDGRYYLNSPFAKRIDEGIPKTFGDYSSSLDTPLNDPKRGFWDFYPFNCQDKQETAESQKSPYWGCRFGCDLDIKFSHMSGDSRVYTLAIGEKGSDCSVDLFGFDEGETHYSVPNLDITGSNEADTIFRRRVIPWSLPHGKTHLIKITVDQYNRISDISHVNTLYGGGGAIVDDSDYSQYKEKNPWCYLNETDWRVDYKNLCLVPQLPASARSTLFSLDANVIKSHERDEIYSEDKTNYWTRSAVVHWDVKNIYDYRKKYSTQNTILRQIDTDRFTKTVATDGTNSRSRFGSVGFGGDLTPFQRVHRFPQFSETPRAYSYQFIFPWVDSFGKSVAISNTTGLTTVSGYQDSDPKTIVLSASTSRSNIEDLQSSLTNYPPLAKDSILTEQDTVSEVGQIQANFVYSDGSVYENIDHIFLNSGGPDCDRLYTNLTRKSPGVFFTQGVRELKTGSLAGFGMPEVISSCWLSGSCLEFVGNEVVWSEQQLYSNKSVINILNFDDGFSVGKQISKGFIDPRVVPSLTVPDAKVTGDGFGVDFKYNQKLFVTNCRSQTTELDEPISYQEPNEEFSFISRDRLDYVHVYEERRGSFKEVQKISATIDKMDEERYSLHLLNNAFGLLDINGSVSYGNNSVDTLTWNIDFTGRYDIVNNKIMIKDPLEYSLFGRDFSVSESLSEGVASEQCDLYLSFSEKVRTITTGAINYPNLYYDYIPQGLVNHSCVTIVENGTSRHTTPVFFYKLPISQLDLLESVTIDFEMIQEDIYSYFDIKGNTNVQELTNNIVPRIVIYGKDPRLTPVRTGPGNPDPLGRTQQNPKYYTGLYYQLADKDVDSDIFSFDMPGWFRGGAQDLFYYGRIPSSTVKLGQDSLPSNPDDFLYGGEVNLGEYYDLTAGSRQDFIDGGSHGDPAWVAPDVYSKLSSSQIDSILPYAKIFLPTASADGYQLTLTKDELKQFIISGDLINDTGRTTDVSFGVDPFGNSVNQFEDSAYKYSNVDDIDYTLAIGFVLTNVNSFDINSGSLTHEEPTSAFNVGPLNYILPESSSFEYVNARYPYSSEALYYESTFEGNKWNGNYIDYNLQSTIRNPTISISKKRHSGKRYSNKFHKVAVFNYDEEARNDVAEVYKKDARRDLGGRYNSAEVNVYSPLGFDRFVPAPAVTNNNPIISIGKKSNAFNLSDEHEVLNTENVSFNDSSYYLDPETGDIRHSIPPTGASIGVASFNQSSLLGSFDIDQDQYLSLFINTNRTEDQGVVLFTDSHGAASGDATLFVPGIGGGQQDSTLFIGIREKVNQADLFIESPFARSASLFTYEVAPSGAATLFTDAPDSDAQMTLVFGQPPTGVIPLNIRGPLQETAAIDLTMTPYDSGAMPLMLNAVRQKLVSDTTLFMDPVLVERGDMSLTFSPGVSGDISLFLARNLEGSGAMSLVMPEVLGSATGAIPLWISRNGSEADTELFIKSESLYNSDVDLYINSQVEQASGISLSVVGPVRETENTDLFLKVALPSSGSVDLNMPVVGLPTGVMSLHINQGYETMPLFTPIVENPAIPLYISGFAIDKDESMNLFMLNRDSTAGMDMVINNPIGSGVSDISLTVNGTVESGLSNGASLFVGKEIYANDNVSLFTNNDLNAPTIGTTGFIAENTMVMSGGLGASSPDDTTLFINVPSFVSEDQDSTLFLKVDEPVFGPGGGISSSGIIDLAVGGNNDANVWIGSPESNQVSLSITAVEFSSGLAPLYIEKPEQANIPMYMASLINSGDITVYITGANVGIGSTDLYISPPEATGVDMFTRGYLE